MQTMSHPYADDTLAELLGTFLQVSAQSAPMAYSLRQVADLFCAWAHQQPVARLDCAYEHLVRGKMDPKWDELGLPGSLS